MTRNTDGNWQSKFLVRQKKMVNKEIKVVDGETSRDPYQKKRNGNPAREKVAQTHETKKIVITTKKEKGKREDVRS